MWFNTSVSGKNGWAINTDIYVCQQEEEQSLVNVLEENVDKMQLTRRILDLKQVTIKAAKMLNSTREVEFPTHSHMLIVYNCVEVSQSLIYG